MYFVQLLSLSIPVQTSQHHISESSASGKLPGSVLTFSRFVELFCWEDHHGEVCVGCQFCCVFIDDQRWPLMTMSAQTKLLSTKNIELFTHVYYYSVPASHLHGLRLIFRSKWSSEATTTLTVPSSEGKCGQTVTKHRLTTTSYRNYSLGSYCSWL